MSMELPLVLFTVASQAAIGLVAFSAVRQFAANGPTGKVRQEWIVAGVVLALGLVASLFHLGHPMGAPNVIKHLGTAWLSAEAIGAGVLLALVILVALTAKGGVNKLLALAAAIVGFLVVLFMGMTYAPPSFPAYNNVLPFAFFLITAAILGPALASYFAPQEKQGMLTRLLTGSLLVGLVVHLLAPCIWLSGGTIMEATGMAFVGSPLYWARIVLGLALPLFVVMRTKSIPAWLPVLLIVGELAGRLLFFMNSIHTASNLGGMY